MWHRKDFIVMFVGLDIDKLISMSSPYNSTHEMEFEQYNKEYFSPDTVCRNTFWIVEIKSYRMKTGYCWRLPRLNPTKYFIATQLSILVAVKK
jgi:hypothetical protein